MINAYSHTKLKNSPKNTSGFGYKYLFGTSEKLRNVAASMPGIAKRPNNVRSASEGVSNLTVSCRSEKWHTRNQTDPNRNRSRNLFALKKRVETLLGKSSIHLSIYHDLVAPTSELTWLIGVLLDEMFDGADAIFVI